MHIPSDAKRILVYRIGSIGDTIVALPCFHLIERRYPNAERVLLTNFPVRVKAPPVASVLEGSDLIHGYMCYSVGTRNPCNLLRLAVEIRKFKPDLLVYLMPDRSQGAVQRDILFFRFAAGVKHIIGFRDAPELIPRRNADTGLYESQAARLARSVADLGDAGIADLANWNLRLTSIERETARKVLGDFVGTPIITCSPGAKIQAKDWGPENWRALLSKISQNHPNYSLVLVGAKEDLDISEYASSDWHRPKVNLCGRLTPRESAAVLEYASVFLGSDSGPMHLAACVGTPCVIAFSARGLPGVWFPAGRGHRILYRHVNCSGCNLETCTVEMRRCLTSITIDEMAAAVDSVLSESFASDSVRLPSS